MFWIIPSLSDSHISKSVISINVNVIVCFDRLSCRITVVANVVLYAGHPGSCTLVIRAQSIHMLTVFLVSFILHVDLYIYCSQFRLHIPV